MAACTNIYSHLMIYTSEMNCDFFFTSLFFFCRLICLGIPMCLTLAIFRAFLAQNDKQGVATGQPVQAIAVGNPISTD